MVKKIQIKFVVVFMTFATIMLIAIMAFVINTSKFNFAKDNIQGLKMLMEKPDVEPAPDNDVHNVHMPFFSLTFDDSGKLQDAHGNYYNLSNSEFLQSLIDQVIAADKEIDTIDEYHLRYLYSPEDKMIVFADITGESKALNHLMIVCSIIFACAFVILLCASIFLSFEILKPMKVAFNNQHQFVSDASHELKTPITIILTNAQMLQTADNFDDVAIYSENINSTAERMRKLVTELLDLARLDDGSYEQNFQQLDFSATVENATLPYDPVFFEKGLTLETDIAENIFIMGNELLIEQLTSILLDNAADHAITGTAVTLSLKQENKHCILTVSNFSDTISPKEIKEIFKRFYKVDKARTDSNHYGLGLSIASKIASLHHGSISCESKKGVTKFKVRFKIKSK